MADEPTIGTVAMGDTEAVIREALTDLLASELGDTYSCTRVWSAWGYGTMTQDDFEPAEERAGEIADSILRAIPAIAAALSTRPAQEPVAIVPPYCSGSALSFDHGVLHVSKDGSGYIAINEEDFVLEDDRCEGPDGPEGSVHWITRMDASEIIALRDFLNGNAVPAPQPVLSQPEVKAVTGDQNCGCDGAWDTDGCPKCVSPLSDIPAQAGEDEAELCIACDVPFEDGDLVYWCSDDTGHLHEDCCGPEREAYVNADGSPLKDGEPIPKPFAWRAGR
jgi:hypothetical protein